MSNEPWKDKPKTRPAIYFIPKEGEYQFNNHNHNIDPTQAENIAKLLHENKYTHPQIAEMVGTTTKTVELISCGCTWRYLYDKYDLGNKKKTYPSRNEFSEDELHNICQYFQDHNKECSGTVDLYSKMMRDLFGKELDHNTRVYLDLIYKRKRRKKISDNYTW